jgi:hypothetical protein
MKTIVADMLRNAEIDLIYMKLNKNEVANARIVASSCNSSSPP